MKKEQKTEVKNKSLLSCFGVNGDQSVRVNPTLLKQVINTSETKSAADEDLPIRVAVSVTIPF